MSISAETGEWVESDEEKETTRIYRETLERVRRMTPEERFQSMVETGIYAPDGRLRKEYGGEA